MSARTIFQILLGVMMAGTDGAAAEMIHRTAANGLRIVVVEDHAQPAVFLRILFPRGENDEPGNLAGLADITADLALKGAGDKDAAALAEVVDELGADLIGEASPEFTVFGCNALAAHLDTALGILRDIVFHPRFDKDELSLIQDQMLANIKAQRSNPSYLAAIHLAPAVFGPQSPQGRVKTESSIKSVRMQDIESFRRRLVQAPKAIVLCAGDVDASKVAGQLEEAFRDLPAGTAPELMLEIPKNLSPDKIVRVEKEEMTQTTALIGKPGPGRLSPDYYSTLVANYILGGGGFVSRLMAAVRAKEGKTYGIRSAVPSSATPDLFDIKFTTRNEELVSSLQLTLDVMKEFIAKGPTATEVDEAKEFFKGYFYLQTETPSQRASKTLVYLFYGLGMEEFERYPKKIDAVTRESAHAAAKKYFSPEGLTFCLVGPKEVIAQWSSPKP